MAGALAPDDAAQGAAVAAARRKLIAATAAVRACVVGDLMHRSDNAFATAMAGIERALVLHLVHHRLKVPQRTLARAVPTSQRRVSYLLASAEAMLDAPVFADAMARAEAAVPVDP